MFTVNDSAGILTPAQRSELVATNASSQVVVNLVNTGSQGELDLLTQKCVTTPNTLCIGRDNAHKWTSVHPGIDLGIHGDAAVEMRKAGNADFRQGDVVGGLKAIVSRSEALRMKQNNTAVVIQNQVVRHETTYWPLFLFGGCLLAMVVFFVLKAMRSAKKAVDAMRVAQGEAADAVSRNIEAEKDESLNRKFRQLEKPDWPSPTEPTLQPLPDRPITLPQARSVRASVSSPAVATRHHHHHSVTPAPVIINNNSGPDFVDGLLIGEALERRESRYDRPSYDPPSRYSEPPRRREPTPQPEPASSFSWGGGSTSDSDSFGSSGGSTSDSDNSSSSSSNVGSDDD